MKMVRLGLRRQLQLYFFILCVGAVAGGLIGAILGPMFLDPPLYGAIVVAAIGAVDTTAGSALIGAVEIFVFRTRIGRAIERAPFLAIYLLADPARAHVDHLAGDSDLTVTPELRDRDLVDDDQIVRAQRAAARDEVDDQIG